jgi:hypothetical protein
MGSGRDVRLVGGKFSRLVSKRAHDYRINRRDRILFQVITEDNRVWRNNERGYFGNHAEHPTISSFTTSLIKPTSVVVGWAGTDYSVVDVKWG